MISVLTASLLMCLLSLVFGRDNVSTGSDINSRDLQIANWDITIGSVNNQEFTFVAAIGGGNAANVKVRVYNKCRKDGATRVSKGYFYGGTPVSGITAIPSNVGPGQTGTISLTFDEGISSNTDIYTPDPTTNDAVVKFCAEVGLYDNSLLVNFAEILLTFSINLEAQFTELTGYAVTQAGGYTAENVAVAFDGTLAAYFCDKTSKVALTSTQGITTQGTEISVCFKVPNGQFEIKSVLDLVVKDAGGTSPSQAIITSSTLQAGSAGTPFAVKTLIDADTSDTNVYVVSFLLYAPFFDKSEIQLTGYGTVLLEFGGATGTRYLRTHSKRVLATQSEESFLLQSQEFVVEKKPSSAHGIGFFTSILGMMITTTVFLVAC